MRDSFVFYRSFFEGITELSDKEMLKVFIAVCKYALNDEDTKLTGLAKMAYTLIKPQLDANKQKWENGCKGGRPKNKPVVIEKDETKKTGGFENDTSKKNLMKMSNENVNVNENGKEIKEKVPAWKNRFDDFWNLYPKKQGKGAAEKSWEKIKPNEDLFNGIMDALRKNIQNNPNWKTENGRFIPNPATWLNQKRWEDSTEWKAAPNKGYEQREYSEDDYKELERRLLGIK